MNRSLQICAGLVVVTTAILISGCGPSPSGKPSELKAQRAAAPGEVIPEKGARGREVYVADCAPCHGTNLEGQPNWKERRADGKLPAPPHDETGHTWEHPDKVLFEVIKYGVAEKAGPNYLTDMTGFKDRLTDQEIWAVIAYIKSTWPERIRKKLER